MSPHKVVILFEIAVTEVVNYAGVLCRLQLRQPYVRSWFKTTGAPCKNQRVVLNQL